MVFKAANSTACAILCVFLAAIASASGTSAAPENLSSGGPAGSTLSIESILKAIDSKEADIKDVALRFEQKTVLKETGDSQTTTGRARILKSPERFLVNFESPVENAASFDGKQLLLYFPDTGQAFKQKASLDDIGKLIGVSPVSPMKNLGDRYKAEIGSCSGNRCEIVFREAPSSATRWRIFVDTLDWMVKGAVLENDEIRIELNWYDFKVNRGLKPSDFKIDLPKGVVVEEGGFFSPFSEGM